MTNNRTWALMFAVCLVASASLSADTIVLRDGRRLQGQLVGIRDGVVEVEVPRGFFGRDRVRLNQDEVARIDFDGSTGSGNQFGGNGSGAGTGGGFGSGDNQPGRPSGMRERSVTVNAGTAWSDTGVTVRAGQTVYFTASGRVKWGPGRQDGPAGERNSPRNDARPMPNRPAAALIGRVGESDDFFFIGDDQSAIRIRGGGRLYLGVNDDYLPDNSGAFRVTVFY